MRETDRIFSLSTFADGYDVTVRISQALIVYINRVENARVLTNYYKKRLSDSYSHSDHFDVFYLTGRFAFASSIAILRASSSFFASM